jgi:6-pyruvoyltetrahydropterin/6-carboxytetrahydropterin synthase
MASDRLHKLHRHTIMRVFEIDAGHRLHNHEGKCKDLHGHRYKFCIYFTSLDLDTLDRVIDFGEVKRRIGGWLEENWDHGMILNMEDPISRLWIDESLDKPNRIESPLLGQKFYLTAGNPTAENLASHLFTIANDLMNGTEVKVSRVECYETPNCMAFAEL